MRAVTVSPSTSCRLILSEVDEPSAGRGEAIVRVEAVSLNPGELRFSLGAAEEGWRPGWDFAGRVERAAVDGSGPPEGSRVVGFLENGAWAERIAVAGPTLAMVPEEIPLALAATLPVAGLTALHALAEGGLLIGSRVLVTAASGGVGRFACQIGAAAGAHVVGTVRRDALVESVRADGAHEVVVTADIITAREHGP
jgi:NADPH:quinone reductase